MEKESTGFKPEYPEDQDDSWEDLTGEFEKVESCSNSEDSTKEHSQEKEKQSCSIPDDYTIECLQEEEKQSRNTVEDSIQKYSESEDKESCSTPEDSLNEYSESEAKESYSTPGDFTKESSEDDGKENGALQKLPSFEVLPEFPKPDFLKLREDVFTQQQATFSFKNMTTSGCSFIGLKRKVHRNANFFPNSQNDLSKQIAIKIKKKSRRKKHNKTTRGDFIASTSGLVLALFATNVITFVLGCSLGWWSRDAIPTLAVYEFHLDPALL